MNILPVPEKLTSAQKNLHLEFMECGKRHLESRQRCIGLLPQIFREKIYLKKGFDSIFEYAGKLAGLSHEQVKRALSLHARFEDKPTLHGLLSTGEVSLNKLAKIASIATRENEGILADQIRLLPCRAVETLVRDVRNGGKPDLEDQLLTETPQIKDGGQKLLFDRSFVHVNKSEQTRPVRPLELLKLSLSEQNVQKLLELQEKGVDLNELIGEMLEKRNEEIAATKENLADGAKPEKSRYLSVAIRRVLTKEYGVKCSIPSCRNRVAVNHHTRRFALNGLPDSRYIAPLCREHHQIAHSIDVKYQQIRLNRARH